MEGVAGVGGGRESTEEGTALRACLTRYKFQNQGDPWKEHSSFTFLAPFARCSFCFWLLADIAAYCVCRNVLFWLRPLQVVNERLGQKSQSRASASSFFVSLTMSNTGFMLIGALYDGVDAPKV